MVSLFCINTFCYLLYISIICNGCNFIKNDGRNKTRNTSYLAKYQLNFESWSVAWGGRGYGAGDTFLRPYFWNSIKMVVPAVFFSTFIGAMTGYVLTKWRFKGDKWDLSYFYLFGCFIPFQAILLPMARTLGVLGYFKFYFRPGSGAH